MRNVKKRERGILGRPVRTKKRNPSLTFRVVMSENAQLQKASARDIGETSPNAKSRSLADASGWDRLKYATSKVFSPLCLIILNFPTTHRLTA
jgi:hypothetical protein